MRVAVVTMTSKLVELSGVESDSSRNELRVQLFREEGDVDDTRWLSPEEQRTWRSFLAAHRLFFDRIERQLQQDAGLPHAYFEILVQLSEAPDRRLRMSELADSSLSSRSRLSHAVARMEEAGWVRRRSCETDKRGQFAELTEAGFERLDAAARGHVEEVRTLLFDVLTPDQ